MTHRLFTFLCCCILILGGTWSHAQDEESLPDITPPRLSLIDGEVSFWRPGAEEWTPARLNTPLTAGDELYADSSAACELQVGPQAYVRAGEATELGVSAIEPDFLQVRLTSGEGAVDVRELSPNYTIEIDTPQGAFTVERPGYYRVNVEQEITSFIARRGGATIASVEGEQPVAVHTDEELVLSGTEPPNLSEAPEIDRWDRWNYDRTASLVNVLSARYAPSGLYGLHDLDHYGRWHASQEYGSVWMPSDVPSEWAPYSTGRWIWDPEYEWTWVDDAPWGWAPFHYGRWVPIDGAWGWAPGPPVATPAYAPALVGFCEGGPNVGWVPLSWGEPVVPWWGPSEFRSRPWWGGWRGPRVVNNEIVNERTVINVNQIVYNNARVNNAVMAMPAEEFGRGRAHFVRLPAAEVHPVHSLERILPARPTPASLVPGTGHAPSPPPQVHSRPVVATRPPRALARVLSEMTRQTAVPPPPQPRLVSRPSPTQLNTLAHPSAKTEQERPSPSLPPRFGAPQRQQMPNRSANLPPSETVHPTPPEQQGVMRTPPPPPSHTPLPPTEKGERGLREREPLLPQRGMTRTTPPPVEQRGVPHQPPQETFRHQPPPPPSHTPLPSGERSERGPVLQHGMTRATPPPVEQRGIPHRPPEETFRHQPPPPPSHTPPPRPQEGATRMLPQRNLTAGTRLREEQRAEVHQPPRQHAVPRTPVPQPQAHASAAPQSRPPSERRVPPSAQQHAARTQERLQELR